jgi:serine protease Do
MNARASAFWGRLKANRLASTLIILLTLAVGILIGTVISSGVKGKETPKNISSDATPLQIPAPQQLSNQFAQISKQLEPSVVNINTESTIKNPHARRRLRPPQGDSSIASSGARAVLTRAASASVRSVRASLWIQRATS